MNLKGGEVTDSLLYFRVRFANSDKPFFVLNISGNRKEEKECLGWHSFDGGVAKF